HNSVLQKPQGCGPERSAAMGAAVSWSGQACSFILPAKSVPERRRLAAGLLAPRLVVLARGTRALHGRRFPYRAGAEPKTNSLFRSGLRSARRARGGGSRALRRQRDARHDGRIAHVPLAHAIAAAALGEIEMD